MLHVSLTVALVATLASSHPAMLKYDQRQEGEWNVRADLENFVIVIIPTNSQSASPPSTGGLTLLDLLSKAVPSRGYKRKHIKKVKEPTTEIPNIETQAFIESKTAPYHVDISRSRNNLAKLHPVEVQTEQSEKQLSSPTISLLKAGDLTNNPNVFRISKDIIVSVPQKEGIVKKTSKNEESNDKNKYETQENKREKLTLLGAEFEQCGPDYERDNTGICRKINSN